MNHRNILVWNLHILSGEYTDEGMYDEALNLVERAEKNWTRDVILGDEIGVYHVSWIEQIWHKQAEICLLVGDKRRDVAASLLVTDLKGAKFKAEVEA